MVGASPQSVVRRRDTPVSEDVPADDFTAGQKWYGKKSFFPVASGALHQGHLPYLAHAFGNDVIIQMGGEFTGIPKVRLPARKPHATWLMLLSRTCLPASTKAGNYSRQSKPGA